MPAYHQFQVHLPHGESLRAALQSYHACWQALIGPHTHELGAYLQTIRADSPTRGWKWPHRPYTWQGLQLLPHLNHWEPDWEISILVEAAELVDANGIYHPQLVGPLTSIAAALAAHFPEVPIFLTDEHSDGRPWEALKTQEPAAIWQFDLAVVPLAWRVPFAEPPEDYAEGTSGTDVWFFREACWPEGPL